jgi:hypothetical protein
MAGLARSRASRFSPARRAMPDTELLERVARQHRARRQRIAHSAVLVASRTARRIDLAHPGPAFDAGPGQELVMITTQAQRLSAMLSERYLMSVMAAQELDVDDAAGSLVPERLAGVASDGRPLYSLLYQPFSEPLAPEATISMTRAALDQMQAALARIISTQVTDAGRVGDGVAAVSRREIKYYVRMLTPPSCSRCALLAGKRTSIEKPFERHPHCDCAHVPVGDTETAKKLISDPMDYFKSLSRAGQDRIFTAAGAQAIREGSDIFQVVNARRGMSPASSVLRTTTEGITRRGFAGRRTGPLYGTGQARLMPEAIYQLARTREEARALLRQHGYLS